MANKVIKDKRRKKLLKDWNQLKNFPLLREDLFTVSLKTKLWWQHKDRGTGILHQWEAILGNRVYRDDGCSVCSGKQLQVGANDLATKFPIIASEWHPDKNGRLSPSDFTPGVSIKVWWQRYCEEVGQLHEWEATILSRTTLQTNGSGCAICHGKQVQVGINDLATKDPELAKEWHPSRNGDLLPTQVTLFSETSVWWRHFHQGTQQWHEWEAKISHRARKRGKDERQSGCHYCSGRDILLGFNDLASQNPALAAEWHPSRNGSLLPTQVTLGNNKTVWWRYFNERDRKYHEWPASINHRAGLRQDACSVCRGLFIQIGVNDLASQYPILVEEWHPTMNGNLTPEMVTYGSAKSVWWKHANKKTGEVHEWEAVVKHRSIYGSRCSECFPHGFDLESPGVLYLINAKLYDNSVEKDIIQFGITNNTRNRLADHRRSGFIFPPIILLPFKKGLDALNLENALKRLMREYEIPTATQRGYSLQWLH